MHSNSVSRAGKQWLPFHLYSTQLEICSRMRSHWFNPTADQLCGPRSNGGAPGDRQGLQERAAQLVYPRLVIKQDLINLGPRQRRLPEDAHVH
jgi:hypothetical protein